MPHRNYLIRQAAWLFKFAKETRDPEVATSLLAKAADLNEQLSVPTTDASPAGARRGTGNVMAALLAKRSS